MVAEQDGSGHIVADNATVHFVIENVCGAPVDLGSVTMNSGVATLTNDQRFYTLASGVTISASTPTLSNSATFNVVVNSDLLFADGFESCRL